jgi:hypothetical protein
MDGWATLPQQWEKNSIMKIWQSFKDNLARLWQDRFKYGASVNLLNTSLNWYIPRGGLFQLTVASLLSNNTGHWPWSLIDVAAQFHVDYASWHVGVLGFTIGKYRVHDIQDGETVGPDYMKLYFMFKGINHQQLSLEEILADAN